MVIFLIVIHWQCGSLLVFFNYYYHYGLIYFLLSCTLPSLLFQFFYIHKSPLCHILLLSSSSLNFLLLTNFLFSYSFPSCQCPLFSLFTEYPISLSVLTLLSEVPCLCIGFPAVTKILSLYHSSTFSSSILLSVPSQRLFSSCLYKTQLKSLWCTVFSSHCKKLSLSVTHCHSPATVRCHIIY